MTPLRVVVVVGALVLGSGCQLLDLVRGVSVAVPVGDAGVLVVELSPDGGLR